MGPQPCHGGPMLKEIGSLWLPLGSYPSSLQCPWKKDNQYSQSAFHRAWEYVWYLRNTSLYFKREMGLALKLVHLYFPRDSGETPRTDLQDQSLPLGELAICRMSFRALGSCQTKSGLFCWPSESLPNPQSWISIVIRSSCHSLTRSLSNCVFDLGILLGAVICAKKKWERDTAARRLHLNAIMNNSDRC